MMHKTINKAVGVGRSGFPCRERGAAPRIRAAARISGRKDDKVVYVVASIGSGAAGFAIGLLAFKVKSRWCPDCGRWTWTRFNDGRRAKGYGL
jgi:hypothetical protein